ncbi:MAG: endonuclease III [Acutalibacteraceae bacterium]|jgi:endonuclease-3
MKKETKAKKPEKINSTAKVAPARKVGTSRQPKKAKDGFKDRERARLAAAALKELYPDAVCSLVAEEPFQLLVATRLSAQCTDARVNMITPALFKKYPTIEAFAKAEQSEVEELVHSCGFYRQKAKDIIGMANMVLTEYGGRVPDSIEELTRLPGVGRKTANLIVGDVYGKPAVVADTHLIRISNRLGLVSAKDPLKVELRLKELLDPSESNDFCHRCVLHGRAVCDARKPRCGDCTLKDFCLYYFELK